MIELTWYRLCTGTSETTPNTRCVNMEKRKDAVCIVVVPKNIGLVYISAMFSKVAVLAGIYGECGNSPTLNVNINKPIRLYFRIIE